MKLSSVLSLVATVGLCLLHSVSEASPIASLQERAASSNKVIVGYFPNWLYGRYPPSQIDFSKYTHIYYAFAIQNTPTAPTWADPGVFDTYVAYGFPKLLSLAHAAGTKVMVSVGGWSGSTQFSTMAASQSNRKAWIDWNVNFIKQYNTDGVDIDWEYPTAKGAGCNAVNPNDVQNLNLLVKELRAALDENFPNDHKEITMAVHITPFGGDTPVKDVSGFVPYVDRFHIMAFDVNGAWNSTSGPNAPFHNAPGFGYPAGFVEGIESWKAAGVPYNKIAGGVAFYGRAQTLTVSSAPETQYNPAVSPNPPLGDSLDGPWQDAYCPSDTTVASGVWRWSNLRSQGVLQTPTTAASPWIRHFDNVTQTPWLYNPTNKQYISYDDPISLGVKAKYAIDTGLAGLFAWSVEEENGELLSAIAPVIANNPPRTPIGTATPTATATATATGTKTTTAGTSTPTSSGGCDGVPTWNASTAYTGGSQVVYNGELYKAQWWTQGDTPSLNGPSWSAWVPVKAC
ncbi:glycoside hydrolase [Rhizopus microsporus var. microsporus]|uniref:Glycoside hydrolase n=2 Tax=Rhizopus microsporus TaxID=58291 RepID=A0A2G4SM03_RHIZD|nr:glycoside hydrolase [Rhizopus microsporus ATCC 52813]ORE03545.1 glycoside hydrolase [Rhizopus microsporus var. microsporus]PHZ09783.1 glycoside hydrolase [Rhizopus microsporus ATCC 52813]